MKNTGDQSSADLALGWLLLPEVSVVSVEIF